MSSSLDALFLKRLKDTRVSRELTQAELASKAGLQPTTIAHFEAGRRKPSFANIRALAKALNISADYLLGEEQSSATVFRNEENLTDTDRAHIQGIIDMMTDKKTKS